MASIDVCAEAQQSVLRTVKISYWKMQSVVKLIVPNKQKKLANLKAHLIENNVLARVASAQGIKCFKL